MTKAASLETMQFGGSHYKGMKIEPVEIALANNLDCLQFSIVKYAMRHKVKNGKVDLQKAIHFAVMALEIQYGVKTQVTFTDDAAG